MNNPTKHSVDTLASEVKKYHQALFAQFYQNLKIDKTQLTDTYDATYIEDLHALQKDINSEVDGEPVGQRLVAASIARYPHITAILPRDLLWYFGGECLHYMGDDELACFQALEERFFERFSVQPVTASSYSQIRDEVFPVTPLTES